MEVIKKFFGQKEEILYETDDLSNLLADLLSEIDEAKLALN